MKGKTNTVNNINTTKHLWKQIDVKQPYSPVHTKKKSARITDFLKTIHDCEYSQHQLTQSEIISIKDLKYSQCSEMNHDIEQRKYFLKLLLKAIKQIWAQLYGQTLRLRGQLKSDLEDLSYQFTTIIQQKTVQNRDLQKNAQNLKLQIENLKHENNQLKNRLSKLQESSCSELSEANKELRIYLKNMNEIMMNYHSKNMELQESIRKLQKKYQNAINSGSTTPLLRSSIGSIDQRLFRKTLSQFPNKNQQRQSQNCDKSDINQQFDLINSIDNDASLLPISPKSQRQPKFYRKSYYSPTMMQVRYVPSKNIKDRKMSQIGSDQFEQVSKSFLRNSDLNNKRIIHQERINQNKSKNLNDKSTQE